MSQSGSFSRATSCSLSRCTKRRSRCDGRDGVRLGLVAVGNTSSSNIVRCSCVPVKIGTCGISKNVLSASTTTQTHTRVTFPCPCNSNSISAECQFSRRQLHWRRRQRRRRRRRQAIHPGRGRTTGSRLVCFPRDFTASLSSTSSSPNQNTRPHLYPQDRDNDRYEACVSSQRKGRKETEWRGPYSVRYIVFARTS